MILLFLLLKTRPQVCLCQLYTVLHNRTVNNRKRPPVWHQHTTRTFLAQQNHTSSGDSKIHIHSVSLFVTKQSTSKIMMCSDNSFGHEAKFLLLYCPSSYGTSLLTTPIQQQCYK